MKCYVGVDLGSTTTKALILDEAGAILGRGITNSRSNYKVACDVALGEALINARFTLISMRLAACGITAVYGGNYCTFSNSSRFFSYRRDGECVRMASFISLNPA